MLLNYILRAVGYSIAGCAIGVGISETVIVASKAKKIKEEYENIKTLEAIKLAAKERVEQIKADPREVIFPLYAGFASGMAWAHGNWHGWHNGWKQGIFDGIKQGVIGLEKQWISKCPKEFRKFIEIIIRNGFPEDVEVFRQRTGRGKDDFRWWGWSPKRLLNDWDDLAKEVVDEATQEA